MRGEKFLNILEKLGKAGKTIGELIEAMTKIGSPIFPSYGTSLRQGLRAVDAFSERRLNREFERKREREKLEAEQKRKQRVYEYLSKLKTQGFIKEALEGDRRVFTISPSGIQKLEQLKKDIALALPDTRHYIFVASPTVVIVSFDVPDKQARKRYWLRSALYHFKFKKLQQSVYIGKGVLPEEFLSDLVRLNLTECVEIFSINKTGSLRHVL